MAILESNSIKSNSSSFNSPITFQTSGGTENGKLSKSWVNFNGTSTVTIRASFNVSSITDNGAGDYTVNFSNALDDANYAFCLGSSPGNGRNPYLRTVFFNDTAGSLASLMSSSQFRVVLSDFASYSTQDCAFYSVTVFR